MPAYNFKKQFADAVRTGEKRQTIRPLRKHGNAFSGATLKLYTGQRTKNCMLLRECTCLSVKEFVVDFNLSFVRLGPRRWVGKDRSVFGDKYFLDRDEMRDLARCDGFSSIEALVNFFEICYGNTRHVKNGCFHGLLIQW